jgi:hypothetical protein
MDQVGISREYLTNTKQIVLLEQFAELIVRECADIADCSGMAFPVNGWVVGDKIRKHFGVEE